MFCLGTVVNVYKLWLCVRLEGLDNSHEKWIFCDDESIQPIGYVLQYALNLSYLAFLVLLTFGVTLNISRNGN